MKSNLKIYTSFVSPITMQEYVKKNLLPIFIIRNIFNSTLIGKYSDTPIHFKDLAPSNVLFRKKRDGLITKEEYSKGYALEMTDVNLEDIINKLETLALCSGASGIVLLGYGSNDNDCHRSVLREILNSSKLLNYRVQEIYV